MNITELRTIAHLSSSVRIYTRFTGHILQDLEIAFDQ